MGKRAREGSYWACGCVVGRRRDVEHERDLVDDGLGELVDVGLDDARVLERVPAEAEEENVVYELRAGHGQCTEQKGR